MTRLFTIVLIASCVLACNFEVNFGDDDGQVLSDPGPEKERTEAFSFASELLQSLDRGEDIYPQVAPFLREVAPKPAFDATLSGLRGWVGTLKSREAKSYGYTESLEDAPPGHYFVISYDSEFQNGDAEEKVVVTYDETGYALAGYFLSRTWSTSED